MQKKSQQIGNDSKPSDSRQQQQSIAKKKKKKKTICLLIITSRLMTQNIDVDSILNAIVNFSPL